MSDKLPWKTWLLVINVGLLLAALTVSFTAGTQNVLYAGMQLKFAVKYAPICDCPGVNAILPPYTLHYQAEKIWDAKP